MKSHCEVFYETLVFMCGTDYGPPDVIHTRCGDDLPHNYCHINNRFNKILLYHKLCAMQSGIPDSEKKAIIIYGEHIKVYEFINFLLNHEVKPDEITIVIPYDPKIQQLHLKINKATIDTRIENILREMVEDLKIPVYDKMNLISFETYNNSNAIKNMTFKAFTGETTVTLDCDLFVSFLERPVSFHMLDSK